MTGRQSAVCSGRGGSPALAACSHLVCIRTLSHSCNVPLPALSHIPLPHGVPSHPPRAATGPEGAVISHACTGPPHAVPAACPLNCPHTAASQHSNEPLLLEQGTYMMAFAATRDAVRFCHAAQAAVLYRKWSSDGAAFFPQATMGTDGRPLLAGPALAMAVHESGHYRY